MRWTCCSPVDVPGSTLEVRDPQMKPRKARVVIVMCVVVAAVIKEVACCFEGRSVAVVVVEADDVRVGLTG